MNTVTILMSLMLSSKTCRVTGKINQRLAHLARLARLAKALRLGILIPFRLKIDIKKYSNFDMSNFMI